MDTGIGSDIVGAGTPAGDIFQRTQTSLENHQRELQIINYKLGHPLVPQGKKDKLTYRKDQLEGSIIPYIKEKRDKMLS